MSDYERRTQLLSSLRGVRAHIANATRAIRRALDGPEPEPVAAHQWPGWRHQKTAA